MADDTIIGLSEGDAKLLRSMAAEYRKRGAGGSVG